MNKNPFLETLVIPYVRVIKRDVPHGKENLHPGDYYDAEKTKATQIYRDPANFSTLAEMSSSGLKVLFWIIYHLKTEATSIKLDDKALAAILGWTERQSRRVRTELIAKALIAKKEDNEYWINPRYFAAASRLRLYKEQTYREGTVREADRQMARPPML